MANFARVFPSRVKKSWMRNLNFSDIEFKKFTTILDEFSCGLVILLYFDKPDYKHHKSLPLFCEFCNNASSIDPGKLINLK